MPFGIELIAKIENQSGIDNIEEICGECDGIMIGRGAMGNPWLFDEIACALEGREFISPSGEERVELALRQLEDMIAARGERAGFVEGKKHMAWYSAGLRGSAAARNEIMQANSCEEIRAIFEELLKSQ